MLQGAPGGVSGLYVFSLKYLSTRTCPVYPAVEQGSGRLVPTEAAYQAVKSMSVNFLAQKQQKSQQDITGY